MDEEDRDRQEEERLAKALARKPNQPTTAQKMMQEKKKEEERKRLEEERKKQEEDKQRAQAAARAQVQAQASSAQAQQVQYVRQPTTSEQVDSTPAYRPQAVDEEEIAKSEQDRLMRSMNRPTSVPFSAKFVPKKEEKPVTRSVRDPEKPLPTWKKKDLERMEEGKKIEE